MEYQSKILTNPTGRKVEFMCGGKSYVFETGETKPVDGFVAYHALTQVNTGLVEHRREEKPVLEASEKAYEDMSFFELRKIASNKGIFKIGMKKKDLLDVLNG